jgi:5-methylcytosine-specific restriction endonuclease McrA
MPCNERRARLLLERGRARVHLRYPFTIRLVDRAVADSALQPITAKLDPGSKKTGLALVRPSSATQSVNVLNLIEIEHRGSQISDNLTKRRGHRKHRRSKLNYRAPRFNNRTRSKGWLAPSLQHRVDGIINLLAKLRKLAPITDLAQELVRFDTQLMQNSDIKGIEYQQGTLQGYEIREYVLEKWGRQCVYCNKRERILNLDHIVPKSRGGSNRPSNLVPACIKCNAIKGNRSIEDFLAHDPARLKHILIFAKTPLKDAAAVNTTRWALWRALTATSLLLVVGTGGRTKYNRHQYGVAKSHVNDAVCVGPMDNVTKITGLNRPLLAIKCMGRGSYRRTRSDAHGFPVGYCMRTKRVYGFGTGDIVRAVVPKGRYQGTYIGRAAIRANGLFDIKTFNGLKFDTSYKNCTLLQRNDGYKYGIK